MQDLFKLSTSDDNELCVSQPDEILVTFAAEKCAHHQTTLRHTIIKLLVDEGTGHHALALTTWYKKAETGWQPGACSLHMLAVVSQGNRNRRGVIDLLQFFCQAVSHT